MQNISIHSLVLTRLQGAPLFSGDQKKLVLSQSSFTRFIPTLFSEVLSLHLSESKFWNGLDSVVKLTSIKFKKETITTSYVHYPDSDGGVVATKCHFKDIFAKNGACICWLKSSTKYAINLQNDYFENCHVSGTGGVLYASEIVGALWMHKNCFQDCSAHVKGHCIYCEQSDYEAESNKTSYVRSGSSLPNNVCTETLQITRGPHVLVYYNNFTSTFSNPNSISTVTGAHIGASYRLWTSYTYFINCTNGIVLEPDGSLNPKYTSFQKLVFVDNTATEAPLLLPINGVFYFKSMIWKGNKGIIFSENPYGAAGLYVKNSKFDSEEPKSEKLKMWITFHNCIFNEQVLSTPKYYVVNTGICQAMGISDSKLVGIVVGGTIGACVLFVVGGLVGIYICKHC